MDSTVPVWVLLLFAGFGPGYGVVCFHLIKYNQTMQQLKIVLRALLKIPHTVGWVGFKTWPHS